MGMGVGRGEIGYCKSESLPPSPGVGSKYREEPPPLRIGRLYKKQGGPPRRPLPSFHRHGPTPWALTLTLALTLIRPTGLIQATMLLPTLPPSPGARGGDDVGEGDGEGDLVVPEETEEVRGHVQVPHQRVDRPARGGGQPAPCALSTTRSPYPSSRRPMGKKGGRGGRAFWIFELCCPPSPHPALQRQPVSKSVNLARVRARRGGEEAGGWSPGALVNGG